MENDWGRWVGQLTYKRKEERMKIEHIFYVTRFVEVVCCCCCYLVKNIGEKGGATRPRGEEEDEREKNILLPSFPHTFSLAPKKYRWTRK